VVRDVSEANCGAIFLGDDEERFQNVLIKFISLLEVFLYKHCWVWRLSTAVSRPHPIRLFSVRISQRKTVL